MKDNSFVLHHVGARNGSRAFPIVPALEHELISVMYEASEDGNDQIIEMGKRLSSCKTILVNACVGKQSEIRDFKFNKDPYTSSLLSLNPRFRNYYVQQTKYDYVIGDVISPVDRVLLRTDSIDDLIRFKSLPKCDFLSVDTQGSELEILEGAEMTLASCVGVQLEVSFVELYQGQPLFGEIDKFLRLKGFEFIKFKEISEWAPQVCSYELRGDKMQFQADAIYFKSPQSLVSTQLYQLLFAALAYGQIEFACSVASEMRSIPMYGDRGDWIKFCNDFLVLSSDNVSSRPSFSDWYSVEQSLNRFKPEATKELVVKNHGQTSKNPDISIRKLVYRVVAVCLGSVLVKYLVRFRSRMRLKRSEATEIEKIFYNAGLIGVADKIRHSRLKLQGEL